MAGITTPVTTPDAYANNEDLQAFWKTISGDDITRSNSLLKLASNRLRMRATELGIDLDVKVNLDPAYFSSVQWVIMEATKRAMLTPNDLPPVESSQLTAGPYSENIKYSNPSGDLWFKRSELSDLGLGAKQSLGSVSTVQGRDIYSSDIWS